MKPNIKERANLVEHMHEIVLAMNDERAYEIWIYCVPDEPEREDFEEIAQNDFEHIQKLFTNLVKNYGRAGWFVDF